MATLASAPQPIKIAILAMGGEGGGVLADWVVSLAEANGHLAQVTSVPGVAQRTGATIYYVELFSRAAAQAAGREPVLALMPTPGDVDIVLASELMEAGRAVLRGLVTPDRTTLITSTHRVYAIAEKVALHDGRADSGALLAQARTAARRFIGFDMARLAEDSGSVVSAVLFGALAASGALPFEKELFEATITRSGIGVASSLKACAAGFAGAVQAARETQPAGAAAPMTPQPAEPPRSSDPEVQHWIDTALSRYEGPTVRLVIEGLRRVIDYQDPAYAGLFLERLESLRVMAAARHTDGAKRPIDSPLLQEAARHLALWMTVEDTIRVADLKTRATRLDRVHRELRSSPRELVHIDEFLHPRLQEVADTLPAPIGRWLLASGAPRRWLERRFARGRVLRTSSLRGYLQLSAIAGLRRWRRSTLRYQTEQARIEDWMADIRERAATDAAAAIEIVRCQALVTGYGDTHERGWQHYRALRAASKATPGGFSAEQLTTLREAALADENGDALRLALRAWETPR